MRVALVHDYLNQYGGAERVLEVLMEMFPEAPVYTLLYDPERTGGRFAGRVAGTGFLDFPFARRHHRWFIPLMPAAAAGIDLGDRYDLVISDTAGFAKGVRYGKSTKHIAYIHTPLRYAWETQNYFGDTEFTRFFQPVFYYLKRWDYRAGQKPDTLIANSRFIAGKIKEYYGRESAVIHPPVDTKQFFYRPIRANSSRKYYLAVGRLLQYKKFDLILETFARLGLPLKSVGSGPEKESLESRIKRLGAANIELIPFVRNEDELRKLYGGAKALIFPQVEDFGLVAAEAQACGTPVIAYAAGGALEIVENGKTGVLFSEQTAEALAQAVLQFESAKFDRAKIARSAARFSKENFQKSFLDAINQAI